MVLGPSDDCGECRPAPAATAVSFSLVPFLATFILVSSLVLEKLFPFLSGEASSLKASSYVRPFSSNTGSARPTNKRLSALTFASTIGLATVLIELILCEISGTVHPSVRGLAFQTTITSLLFNLIIVIPFLEIYSVIAGAGYEHTGNRKGRLRLAWIIQALGFSVWILGFWWTGAWLLGRSGQSPASGDAQTLSEASLERIGVIGISVMSLLSGFASVSSPWQNLFSRPKPVTEASIARKSAGLEATHDMLTAKRSRLRALEQKISAAPSESFFQRAVGSIRGNVDATERQILLLEISGLETMAVSLSTTQANLQSRLQQQQNARTASGRLLITASYFFSLFCVYRIATTSLTFIRRSLSSYSYTSGDFTTSDPVDNILALLARHYDPHLDQAVWARQISFLLSGIILFASFSSVMQTFHLFARFLPSLLKTIQANLALVVAQVCATYVISAALMLRGMMPGTVLGEGLGALGGKNGVSWIDGWFERWFLGGVLITFIGIWIGRKVGGSADWEDEEFDDLGGVESGKRS